MKKLFNFVISILLLVLISLTACGEKNAYKEVREYIDKNRTFNICFFDDGLMAAYDEDTGNITFMRNESGADIFIEIEISENSSYFSWRAKTDDYSMKGECEKKSISTSTRSLPYETTTAPSYLRSILNENCALALQLLLYSTNYNLKTINITVADLGFKNFR